MDSIVCGAKIEKSYMQRQKRRIFFVQSSSLPEGSQGSGLAKSNLYVNRRCHYHLTTILSCWFSATKPKSVFSSGTLMLAIIYLTQKRATTQSPLAKPACPPRRVNRQAGFSKGGQHPANSKRINSDAIQ
jgi:hypothetical protein